MPVDYAASLAEQCEQIWEFTQQWRRDEFALRREQPLLRYWDAEIGLHFVGGNEYKANFSWIANDSGPGQIEIPFNTPLAQWIHDTDGRIERGEGRNIVILLVRQNLEGVNSSSTTARPSRSGRGRRLE